MHTVVIALKLLKPYQASDYPGIARLLSATKFCEIGDNAFLVRTTFEPEEIVNQIYPHLVRGECISVFTATRPAHYFVPEFIGQQIGHVLEGESESSESIPPTG
jgi:hypothetical protein